MYTYMCVGVLAVSWFVLSVDSNKGYRDQAHQCCVDKELCSEGNGDLRYGCIEECPQGLSDVPHCCYNVPLKKEERERERERFGARIF